MPFYIDTSALVKRYIKENGSDFVNDLFEFTSNSSEHLYTASHTLTEFGSAVMRLSREGVLTNQQVISVFHYFQNENRTSLAMIDLIFPIIQLSFELVRKHPLKGADALHLACAVDTHKIFGADLFFVSGDKQLCTAAELEGIQTSIPGDDLALKILHRII